MPNFNTSISQLLFDHINGLITADQAGPDVLFDGDGIIADFNRYFDKVAINGQTIRGFTQFDDGMLYLGDGIIETIKRIGDNVILNAFDSTVQLNNATPTT